MEWREEDLRTGAVIGAAALEKLRGAHVAVFGIGGVGGALCEALARAGVGSIDLIDADRVSPSNINRQIIALHSTLGAHKTEAMRDRILDINPDCAVTVHNIFYLPENADTLPLSGYDYVADAVDTVAAKIELAVRCREAGVPFIASMGTGNKLDPTRLRVADLAKTEGCPLARVMRRELKKRGITHCSVVYSPEEPVATPPDAPPMPEGRRAPGSVSFVPPVAGYMMAGRIIADLIAENKK